MRRASYRAAVRWIAENDAPGDDLTVEEYAGLVSVCLVADLFDVDQERVAADVVRCRERETFGAA